MKLKKKELKLLFLIALAVFGYCSWVLQIKEAQAGGSLSNDDFIRFHVIANSDSAEDQALKLKVRDGLLAAINEDMAVEAQGKASGNEPVSLDIDSSREYIRGHLAKIERTARTIIRENGYDYGVKANLGVRWIPEKTYGNLTFPAGNYQALNVTIGSGDGQNWWCVLFPPLCLIDPDSPQSAAEAYDAMDAAEVFSQAGANVDGFYSQALLDGKYKELMKAAEGKDQTTVKLKFKSAELLNRL